MFPSRLSRRLTTILVILVALDAKDCRYHRADNSVIRAQCSLPFVSPTPLDYRALVLRGHTSVHPPTHPSTRGYLYSYSRWGNTMVFPLLHSNDVVLLCGVPEAIVRLVSVSVCYRLVSGECCGARLRRRQPRIKLMYELPDPRRCLADGLRLRCSTEGKAPRKFAPILPPSRTMLSRSLPPMSCR